MTSRFLQTFRLPLLLGALCLAVSIPTTAAAAELPYRKMALASLHCQQIRDQQKSRKCLRKASAPIHATCQKLNGQYRKACYRKLGGKLRAAITSETRKRQNR